MEVKRDNMEVKEESVSFISSGHENERKDLVRLPYFLFIYLFFLKREQYI